MASKTSKPERAPVPLADFVADVERRRLAAGVRELARNSGARRTESKKALLNVVGDAAAKKGFKW